MLVYSNNYKLITKSLQLTAKAKKMKYWFSSILNSYSQIFYSLNKVLALTILLTTFFTPHLGLSGLFAVVLVNVTAYLIGINRTLIVEGLYGFNALLLGLFLGFQYEVNSTFVLLFIVSQMMLLIISVWLFGIFSRYKLPFLSFPFIITYAIIAISASSFQNISFNMVLEYNENKPIIYYNTKNNKYFDYHYRNIYRCKL